MLIGLLLRIEVKVLYIKIKRSEKDRATKGLRNCEQIFIVSVMVIDHRLHILTSSSSIIVVTGAVGGGFACRDINGYELRAMAMGREENTSSCCPETI